MEIKKTLCNILFILGMILFAFQIRADGLRIDGDYFSNKVKLVIHAPSDFTNRVEIYSCDNLLSAEWSVITENLFPTNGNSVKYSANLTNAESSFFAAGNMDIDSDGDSLSDVREIIIYKTKPDVSDTDNDGLPDGWEIKYNLDPLNGTDFSGDSDNDGLNDLVEYNIGLDPTVFNKVLDVKNIAFNYDSTASTNDAIIIRENKTTAISIPEYVKDIQNKPAAYVRNSSVKILVKFEVSPTNITSLKIKGVSDDADGVLGDTIEKLVLFENGISIEGTDVSGTTMDESQFVEFDINLPITNIIKKAEDGWNWNVSEVNGISVSDFTFETTTGHTIYVLWDDPKNPWRQVANGHSWNPWVKTIDFAIDTANAKNKNDTNALTAITSHLIYEHGLSYETDSGAAAYVSSIFGSYNNIGEYIDKSFGNVINCYDQASGICTFGRLLGIGIEYCYMGPFGYINVVDLVGEGGCNNPFYPTTSGEKIAGKDLLNPDRSSFGNHAFAKYEGMIFDACAGTNFGARTVAEYVDEVIDTSTTPEADVAGEVSDIRIEGFFRNFSGKAKANFDNKKTDSSIAKRAEAIMLALNVDTIKTLKTESKILSEKQFLLKTELQIGKNKIQMKHIINSDDDHRIIFSNQDGEKIGWGTVNYLNSVEEARLFLFQKLALNSLPLELLLKKYKIDKFGAGDLCCSKTTFGKNNANNSPVYFVRKNAVVSVITTDKSINADDIANAIDKKIIN